MRRIPQRYASRENSCQIAIGFLGLMLFLGLSACSQTSAQLAIAPPQSQATLPEINPFPTPPPPQELSSPLLAATPNTEIEQRMERLVVLPEQGEDVKIPPPPPVIVENLEPVLFELNKSTIRPEYEPVLRRNVEWLRRNPKAVVRLEGHADERGSNKYNLALGERRAQTVFRAMVRLGAQPRQMRILSFGEERPLASSRGEEAYSKNRRVEFTLL
jgi:peptidoglycan-associated lipoprotein